ncbi:MAG: LysM peptidoglycan-binding domain-containing protein [Chloroflexi bacterium]|nr:LysM peptidoglycan-binding domain-containing protein [Chloroflexota bacterium]
MTPRNLLLGIAFSLLLLPGLLAACGGGGDQQGPRRGQLTDPRSVPTASPWPQPPEPIILEPGAITPLAGTSGPTAGSPSGPEATGAPGECGETYTVVSGDYPGLIAEKCGVSLQALLDANPSVEPTNLHIGDVLDIPQ